jgi:hypothetical protein
MLDYISQQLKARQEEAKAFEAVNEEAQMNEAILECAHLFQELDDLSVEGTEAGSSRPFTKIDIPLEDDIEITAVEMNLLDGRVTNVPGDANVQESDTDYTRMKTMNDFYQEAYNTTMQYQRESDEEFANRVEGIAREQFAAYKNYCIQEGLFGFDRVELHDDRVPSKIVMECGTLYGKDYSVKLDVNFEAAQNRTILKKQLDSVIAFRQNGIEAIQEAAFTQFGPKVDAQTSDALWDKITPVGITVPKEPADKLAVVVEFEIDSTGEKSFVEWSQPIKGGESTVTTMDIPHIYTMTKSVAIQQEAAMIASGYRAPSRFVQEAIDFGNPDEAPAANPDAPAVSFDAPPADGMEQPAGDDTTAAPPAEGTEAPVEGDTGTETPADGENKEVVDTNNVSDQIAEKVADETQNDANAENDVNIDGVDADLGGDEAPTEDELNAELGGGDEAAPAVDDMPAETSDVDFDNMSMDEILAQAQEKMKSMPMEKLKEFLQSSDTNVQPPVDSDVPPVDNVEQEAFFLTRGNINKELDIHLRKALGILNSSDMEIEQICSEFKKEGWKLNRVVHHASKMTKSFNETERNQLLKLNHCLSDLIKMLRADIDQGSIMTVKRMIQAFVSEATGVLKMVEAKMGKPVQESVDERSRLRSAIYKYAEDHMPADFRDDVKASEQGNSNCDGEFKYSASGISDLISDLIVDIHLADWSEYYDEDARHMIAVINNGKQTSVDEDIATFEKYPCTKIQIGTAESIESGDQFTLFFDLKSNDVFFLDKMNSEKVVIAKSWSKFKSKLTSNVQEGFFQI